MFTPLARVGGRSPPHVLRARTRETTDNRQQTTDNRQQTTNRQDKFRFLVVVVVVVFLHAIHTTPVGRMKVASSAALGTLTVSDSELANDELLQWILKIASAKQLKVQVKKNALLGLECSGQRLTQRSAIIRCLCGMGLHNALDNSPFYLMGGYSAAVAASPQNAMAIASISSWMSVADHAKTFDPELLGTLNSHLETRAFLISSCCTCTIADIDLALVVLKKYKDDIANYPNVHRWVLACSSPLPENGITVPSVDPIPQKAPIFFYGTEDVALPKRDQPKAPQASAKKDIPKDQKEQQQLKQQQPKKEKKQPQQKQQPPSFDVSALEIRVGVITKAWHHPESVKLFCEEIDVGEDAPRQIASGLRPFYQTADLEGRRVVVLCNLKARNLVGFSSHGMVLCASNADHTKVEFMEPPDDAKIGERVLFEGFEGDPEPENKIAKKKIFEGLAPDLKTNAEGVCLWNGATSKTSGGPIKASKGMPDAQVS
jgi:aminoacyl tRNA synthase complex-interacting multifunctional protein 1